MDWEEERPEMGSEAWPEEGDEAETPLGRRHGDGQDAGPGVQAVRVRDGRLRQAVAVKSGLYTKTGEDCSTGHH